MFIGLPRCVDFSILFRFLGFQVVLVVKKLPANSEDARDAGSIPDSEGNDDPLQYSCLGKPMDRGAWWATVHGVAKTQT